VLTYEYYCGSLVRTRRRASPTGLARDENGREKTNHFCFHILIRKREWKWELLVGKTKTIMRNIENGSIRSESMSITGGNRYSKAVILTTSNVRLDIMVTTIHNIKANSTIV